MFNDEDFHFVEILETVVRQSGVLAHRKKCLFGKALLCPFRRLWKGCLDSATNWRPHTEHIYICILTLWFYNMKQGNHDNEQFHFISAKYKQNIDNKTYIQWRRIWNSNKYKKAYMSQGRRGPDRMVVRFTTTYVISVYHHWFCELESWSGRGAQHYMIKLASNLR